VCICSLSYSACKAHAPYYTVVCILSYPAWKAHAQYYTVVCILSYPAWKAHAPSYTVVCILSYPACKAHAPYYIVKWPVRFFRIVPHYLMNGTIFGKKLLNVKCAFWFSLQHLDWNISHSKKNSAMYYRNINWFSRQCQSFLSGFNERRIFWTDFRKTLEHQISRNSTQKELGCTIRTDRQSWQS
jgi:hypothetical protein